MSDDAVDDQEEAKRLANTDIRVLLTMMSERQRTSNARIESMQHEQIRWQAKHDDHHASIERDVNAAFTKIQNERLEREKLAGRVRLIWQVPAIVAGAGGFLMFLVWLIMTVQKNPILP